MAYEGGIVNVLKPSGINSFKVVIFVRRIFGTRKVGHIGTLDPFAEGVLPVFVDKATKLARYADGHRKKYRVCISLGARTDTQDVTGKITEEKYPDAFALEELRRDDFKIFKETVKTFVGESYQLTPMYSARKVNGKPLYKYAREGKEIQRDKKKITIYSAETVSVTTEGPLEAYLDIECSAGTYIRTICDDLGVKLGYFAHAKELIRLSSGPFGIEDSVSLEEIERLSDEMEDVRELFGKEKGFYLPDKAVQDIPKVSLDPERILQMVRGQMVYMEQGSTEDKYAVYDPDDKFIGVIKRMDNDFEYRAERVFTDVNKFKKQ